MQNTHVGRSLTSDSSSSSRHNASFIDSAQRKKPPPLLEHLFAPCILQIGAIHFSVSAGPPPEDLTSYIIPPSKSGPRGPDSKIARVQFGGFQEIGRNRKLSLGSTFDFTNPLPRREQREKGLIYMCYSGGPGCPRNAWV